MRGDKLVVGGVTRPVLWLADAHRLRMRARAQIAVPAEGEAASEQQPQQPMLKVVTQRCSAALGIVPDDLEVNTRQNKQPPLPPTRSARSRTSRAAHLPSQCC